MWGEIVGLVGRGVKGAGEVKSNFERKRQKAQLGNEIGAISEISEPIGAQLQEGYAPDGWYRRAVSANQEANAMIQRAREEDAMQDVIARSGGIRSGAAGDKKGAWVAALARAGLLGDLAGVRGGAGYDLATRFRKFQREAPEPVQNPYAFYGNALQGVGAGLGPSGGGGYNTNGLSGPGANTGMGGYNSPAADPNAYRYWE